MTLSARRQRVADEIGPLIRAGAALDVLAQRVKDLKDLGCTQQETYDALAGLRPTLPPELDDRLLELMDLVVGWCAKADYLWPEPLQG